MAKDKKPAQPIPKATPFLTLSYFRAPKFCPTNVASAWVKQVMGRKAKPSIF